MKLFDNLAKLFASLRKSGYEAVCDIKYAASLIANGVTGNLGIKFRNVYKFECFDAAGNLKWVEVVPNQVMTAGINDLLTNYFKGSAYTATFYVGLVDNAGFSAFAAGDTMAQIAGTNGWRESVAYSNANRPTLTLGTASAGSINNSGNVAVFNVNGTATINGAFVTTNNTKSGSTGTLYGAASFTGGNRAVQNGDTLNVTVTLSAS